MKGITMKAPALAQVYQHKVYITYQSHKRKLDRIRAERKTHLGTNLHRLSQLQSIKESKSKSFAHKFNEHSQEINQSNVKFLGKLEKVRPTTQSTRRDQNTLPVYLSSINPYIKKRMYETEQENTRIYNRMRSMSSSLNKSNFQKDYARSQMIKTRITRYAHEDNKILLKSEKYLSNSIVSKRSVSNNLRPTYYKKEEILKNKVNDRVRIKSNDPESKSDSFFTTEPNKIKERKKIHF